MPFLNVLRFPSILLIAILALLASCASPGGNREIAVMTFNIRLDLAGDGDNAWPHRKEMVAGIVKEYRPDLLGIQEGLQHQVEYLDRELEDYSYIGVGRDDGATSGEYCALYYRTDRFRVLEDTTFWLSETPDRPSVGWDAQYPRLCTAARMEELESKRKILVLNTHFDHVGAEARIEAASLIRTFAGQMTGSGTSSMILTGDFNSIPGSEPIRLLSGFFQDACALSNDTIRQGTFTGFNPEIEDPRILDYIFTSQDLAPMDCIVITDTPGGQLPSDHFPVWAKLRWMK